MNTKIDSGVYVAPEISVIEIKCHRVLCASGYQNEQYNYNDDPGWFD